MQGSSQRGLHARNYGQLCQSLLDMELASETIFNTITSRVNLEHGRLKVLKDRVQSVQNQVDSLKGTSRATTVFSSSKYPVISAEVQDFTPLFGGKIAGTSSEFPLSTILLSSGQCQGGGEGTYELFRFFSETNCESRSNVRGQKGIGSLPTNVNYIADALLFNTAELPYLKYRHIDNLIGSEKLLVREPTTEMITLAPAPQSVQDCSDVRRSSSEDFGFRPVLGKVPSFTLPSTLPDLPMVAEISWSGSKTGLEQLLYIAPSASPKNGPKDIQTYTKDGPRTPISPNQDVTALKIEETMQMSSLTPSTPLLPIQPPVPPPPPLPALPALAAGSGSGSWVDNSKPSEKSSTGQSYYSPSLPPIDSQRAALMTSIRDPSITLRKTNEIEPKRELPHILQDARNFADEGGPSRQKQPVSLLAEMATSLKMRRLSMTGAAHDKEQATTKLVERLGVSDDAGTSSPSGSSGKFTFPIANLRAYIAKKNEDVSDSDEEWDD